MTTSLADIARVYDIRNCPRGDGGILINESEIVDYPGESPQRFFSCSVCGKFWTVIELKRVKP